jgi:sulfonate transport system permease protein
MRVSSRIRQAVLPLVLPAVFFAAWDVIGRAGLVDPRFLPPLEQLGRTAVRAFAEDGMGVHLLASVIRDLQGFGVGATAGVAAGLMIGSSRLLQRMMGPLLVAHRQVALFAWIPLLSMWFGGGEAGKLAFIALAAFQPTLTNTWQGVANIPAQWRELAAVLTFSRLDTWWLVGLPAALPAIFTGLQSALIYAWVATIGAELLLNVAPGLGGRMNEGQQLFHMDDLLLCVFLMGGVGVVFNVLAGAAQTRLLRWRTR